MRGTEAARRIPALVFCFNREQCWTVAEQLKGQKLMSDDQKKRLAQALAAAGFRLPARLRSRRGLLARLHLGA